MDQALKFGCFLVAALSFLAEPVHALPASTEASTGQVPFNVNLFGDQDSAEAPPVASNKGDADEVVEVDGGSAPGTGDPPEVVRLDCEARRSRVSDAIREEKKALSATMKPQIAGCVSNGRVDPLCLARISEENTRNQKLLDEKERLDLAAIEEECREALDAAHERTQMEEQARVDVLKRLTQAQSDLLAHQQQQGREIAKARDADRLSRIRAHRDDADALDSMLRSLDPAEESIPGAFGDVSESFRAQRREVRKRAWVDPLEPSDRETSETPGAVVRRLQDPAKGLAQLQERLARWEALFARARILLAENPTDPQIRRTLRIVEDQLLRMKSEL